MAYKNSDHNGRLIIIPEFKEAYANLFVNYRPQHAHPVSLILAEPPVDLNLVPESSLQCVERHLYNMPFLLDYDGMPWREANSFLLYKAESEYLSRRPTETPRKAASRLLTYKMFCEKNNIDWLDFSGKRRAHRPTYRYFRNLADSSEKCAAVINQHTGIIYDFYSYVSKNWHEIDIDRVDTVSAVKLLFQTHRGSILVDVKKRSQTKRTPGASQTPIGYVRESGEDLRPLTNSELSEMLSIIESDSWSQMERLMIITSLMTGARKQSVLTLRLRHLSEMKNNGLQKDGTFRLRAGPNTGIDTKFNKEQVLHFPKALVDQLTTFVLSKAYKKLHAKFKTEYASKFPQLNLPTDEDAYIFLSDQGNCYYMARNDCRYPYVRSRPIGQVTDNIKRKLIKYCSEKFPKDFSHHWLRATFGYQLYQWLLPLIHSGHLKIGEEISIIQRRMHHNQRETTEKYLKLYANISEKLKAQELYESELFSFNDVDVKIAGVS